MSSHSGEETKRGEVYNGFTILVLASHKCILKTNYPLLLDITAQIVNQQKKANVSTWWAQQRNKLPISSL
jgi:hypothetical protein